MARVWQCTACGFHREMESCDRQGTKKIKQNNENISKDPSTSSRLKDTESAGNSKPDKEHL